jgi:hypothetical protein
MKMFVEPADIYLYMDVVTFRKSINGFIAVVKQDMNLNSFRDALLVFCNKKRDKVKILYWDKAGFALWYKRLEKHRFKWPVDTELQRLLSSERQLQWLLLERNLRYTLYSQRSIENNRVERAIKPFVIGRKNWLFSQTASRAYTSAVLYSIVETAKANHLVMFEHVMSCLNELSNPDTNIE